MSSAKFFIRQPEENDFPTVERLSRDLLTLDQVGVPGLLRPNLQRVLWRGTFLNVLENGKEETYFVAEAAGKVVGIIYVALQRQEEDEVMAKLTNAEIGLLYVLPKYRRQGIATALVKAAEKWAHQQKADRLTVVVYPYATEAAAFYAQHGLTTRSVKLDKEL